jgi:hypothetical protein
VFHEHYSGNDDDGYFHYGSKWSCNFFWYGTMSEQVVSGKGNFWGVISEDVQTMNKGNPIIFKLFV